MMRLGDRKILEGEYSVEVKRIYEEYATDFIQKEGLEPFMYGIVFFNDDNLDFDFFVDLIMKNFGHSLQEAETLAWEVHNWGNGMAGLYSKEIAETKVQKLQQIAKIKGFHLPCRYGVD
jgi:ATP-dependent Clp protease adaptor protein ClpS